MIFLELFNNFFVIGLFTIGGGYAMLPLIQQKVIYDHAWITETAFTDIVAVSQMTPGPIGINSATYIGYNVIKSYGYSEVLCICGSLTTTIAVVLPSFLIVLALCHVYRRFNHSKVFNDFMSGLKPVTVGLIGAAAVLLVSADNFPDWKSWLIFGASLSSVLFTKINPILILLAAGVTGFLIY